MDSGQVKTLTDADFQDQPIVLTDADFSDSAPEAAQSEPVVHSTYFPSLDLTVGTDAALSHEERQAKLYEEIIAQKYNDPFEKIPPVIFPRPPETMDSGYQPQSFLEQGPVAEAGTGLLSRYDIRDLSPPSPAQEMGAIPTETFPTNAAFQATYIPRRVAGEVEKSGWAITEGILRASKAVYQYAPDSATDFFIKRADKEKTVGRLTQLIDYYHKPEKYGVVLPQVEMERKQIDEARYHRNYAYGMINSLGESVLDVTTLFGEMGLLPAAKPVKYLGEKLPYVTKEALHAVKTMAPFALATTGGGLNERVHAALLFSAFGMVRPIVEMTGYRKITATMLASIMNHALTLPDIMAMRKESGGINKEFFKLFVPLMAQNIGFAVFLRTTKEGARQDLINAEARRVAKLADIPVKEAKSMINTAIKELKNAEKGEKPPASIVSEVVVDPTLPADMQKPVVEITIDYNIPEKVPTSGKERTKLVFPEWKNPQTIEGLNALRFELNSLESPRFSLVREGGDRGNMVVGTEQTQGYSPEHLRDLKPRKTRQGNTKSDLGMVDAAIAGEPLTIKQHNRIVDLLKAQENHDRVSFGIDNPESIAAKKAQSEIDAEAKKVEEDASFEFGANEKPSEIQARTPEETAVESARNVINYLENGQLPLVPSVTNEQSTFAKELIASDVVKSAISKGDISTDVARYLSTDMAAQSQKAIDLMNSDPALAMRVATGDHFLEVKNPGDLQGFSVYLEMINKAREQGDGLTLIQLAKSPYASQASQAGSTLSSISHLLRRELDPVQGIKEVKQSREKASDRDAMIADLKKRAETAEALARKLQAKAGRSDTKKIAYGEKNRIFTKEMHDQALKDFKSVTLGSLINPEKLNAVVTIGGYHVESGVRKFSEWSERMVGDLGDSVRPYLKTAWAQIQDKISKQGHDDALAAIKENLKKSIDDLGRQIDSGAKDISMTKKVEYDAEANALKATRDALKKEYDNIFFATKSPEKQIELATKSAEREVANLERTILEGNTPAPKKTLSAWSPKISELKQRAAELRAEIKTMKELANPKATPEERALTALKSRLARQTKSYEDKLSTLDFSKKQPKQAVYDAEALKAKEEADRARKAYNDAKEVASVVTKAEADEIASLSKDALEKKSFIPEDAPDGSPERMEYGRAEGKYFDYISNLKHKAEALKVVDFRTNPAGAVGQSAQNILGMSKALAASFDNGVIGRQGLKLLFKDPKIWAKNAIKSFDDIVRTFKGEDVLAENRAYLFSRTNHLNGKDALHELYLGKEEAFPASPFEKLPLGLGKAFKASEVAYTSFTHRTRAELFDKLLAIAESANLDTKGIGIHVNSVTGRGDLGRLEKYGDLINVGLFSGRFLKSNIDMLTGQVADYGKMGTFAKKEAQKSTVVSVAAITAILVISNQIAKLFGNDNATDADSRSTAFGKLKFGKKSYDMTAGAASIVTLISRILPVVGGYKNRKTGIVSPVWGDDARSMSALKLIQDFARGKVAPLPGLILDFLNNMKDYKGDKLTLAGSAGRFAPMTPATVIEGFRASEDGIPSKVADALTSIPDFVGIGTNIETETPESIVSSADQVQSEINRLEKNGDFKSADVLRDRNKKILDAGEKLRDYQKDVTDTEKEIKDTKDRVDISESSKKSQIESLNTQLESYKKIADEQLKRLHY